MIDNFGENYVYFEDYQTIKKRTEDEKKKSQAIALKTLQQFQNEGLTEKEVLLAARWLNEYAEQIVRYNRSFTSFSVPGH